MAAAIEYGIVGASGVIYPQWVEINSEVAFSFSCPFFGWIFAQLLLIVY